MLLIDCKIGLNQESIDLEILTVIPLTEDLLKMVLQDSSQQKVNLFIEGAKYINFFSEVKEHTLLRLANFVATQNFTQISQYFPTYIPGMSVAIYNSDCQFFISVSENFPNILLIYNANTLEITATTNIENLNLKSLYEMKTNQIVYEKYANPKFLDLKSASERLRKENNCVYFSCYAIIVDSSGPYMPKHGKNSDYLVNLKITDPSIFPEHAKVNIFIKNPKDFPKFANFGDIIKLNEVNGKEFLGNLQLVISSMSSESSFLVFSYSGESIVPYINYKCRFHNSSEHSSMIKNISQWALRTFNYEFPLFIKNSKRISNATVSEEIDLITKIVEIFSMGVHQNDPKVCICADGNEYSQLIIPEEKVKMLKYIEKNDTVRIRSVMFEERVIYLNYYSDILRIPNEFKKMIIVNSENNEQISKFNKIYAPSIPFHVISIVSDNFKHLPVTPFKKVLSFPHESVIRLEGFIVKMRLNKGIDFILWDGENEKNLVRVHIDENNILEFLNGKNWENVKNEIVGCQNLFQVALKVDHDCLKIVSTKLIN